MYSPPYVVISHPPQASLLTGISNFQIPSRASTVNIFYAGTSNEVREKDISGKYRTPYRYINSAPGGKAAGNPVLGKDL